MRVPLTVLDFIERAELVYGDRIGVVDEPDQPAESLGELTWSEIARRARAPRPRGSTRSASRQGERVAIVSHNSARLLTSFFGVIGVRARARADQLPAQRRRDRLHRRALGRVGAARRSRARGIARGVTAKHRFVLGAESDDELLPIRHGARAVDRRRGRDRHDQLHERHDGAPEGRAAHAPHPLGQRDHVRLADAA